jgi:hypothetical protein
LTVIIYCSTIKIKGKNSCSQKLISYIFPDRTSEKLKGKKIQKSLLSMMEKKDEDDDDEETSDVEKEETSARYMQCKSVLHVLKS